MYNRRIFALARITTATARTLERRLIKLERIVYVMCRDRKSDLKRRTMFDYIEFWLSTTVHQTTCTRGEEKVQDASDLARKDAMVDQ
jgi:hypothetical protein